MPLPIHFDGQTPIVAVEVQDVRSEWVLPPKSQTFERLPSQLPPEEHLRQAHRGAKLAGPSDGALGRMHGESLSLSIADFSPLPALRADFPQRGKIRRARPS